MIKNKKGFLRILEAFIAIMLIAGVLAFIYMNNVQKPNKNEVAETLVKVILEDIQSNPDLRTAVLANPSNGDSNWNTINNEIKSLVDKSDVKYNYAFKICPLDAICTPDGIPKGKEVVSGEISISATLQIQDYKKIAVSLWEE